LKKLNDIYFYFITDSKLSIKGNMSDVENALKAGCKIIQYREKNKSTKELIKDAKKIKENCKKKAIFLINDRIDVALAVNSDGVHLGQDDMPFDLARKILGNKKIIGLTVHNLKEAINAEKIGADYISLSPIFNTNTKSDAGKACGIQTIKIVKKNVNLPIVAIGGINKDNVGQVIKAGADGIVAISAVICSKNVRKEVKDFIRIIKENKSK
jgi:thiamine-phosphate pyrophosphorylase